MLNEITKEQKIDFIYSKIADHTLNFGCMFKLKYEFTTNSKNKILFYGYPKQYNAISAIDLKGKAHWVKISFNTTMIKDYEQFDIIETKPIITGRDGKVDYTEYVINNIKIIGHPIMMNRIEFLLNKDNVSSIKNLINKDELIKPIEQWNESAINKLYENVMFL